MPNRPEERPFDAGEVRRFLNLAQAQSKACLHPCIHRTMSQHRGRGNIVFPTKVPITGAIINADVPVPWTLHILFVALYFWL